MNRFTYKDLADRLLKYPRGLTLTPEEAEDLIKDRAACPCAAIDVKRQEACTLIHGHEEPHQSAGGATWEDYDPDKCKVDGCREKSVRSKAPKHKAYTAPALCLKHHRDRRRHAMGRHPAKCKCEASQAVLTWKDIGWGQRTELPIPKFVEEGFLCEEVHRLYGRCKLKGGHEGKCKWPKKKVDPCLLPAFCNCSKCVKKRSKADPEECLFPDFCNCAECIRARPGHVK